MRRRKIESGPEKVLLRGMIASKLFLASAVQVLGKEPVGPAHVRRIMRWCVDFFNEYGEAPGNTIRSQYEAWAEDADEDEADSVGDLLELVDEEDDQPVNVPYLVDRLSDYVTKHRLRALKDRVEAALANGDYQTAQDAVTRYRSPAIGVSQPIDPLRDAEVWERAFSEPANPIVEFPGDGGRFLNHALTRDALVAIQGPEKRGKTFWCLEFVVRSLRCMRKVAWFEVGDLSEAQMLQRIAVRLSSRPLREKDCGTIQVPKKLRGRGHGKGEDYQAPAMDFKEVVADRPVSARAAQRAAKKFMRRGLSKETPSLLISSHPNSSINVKGIEAILDRWEQEHDFVPDVIVIDYADILAPEDSRLQGRDVTNETWKALRRLSQSRHALVVTPTQADAASYDKQTLGMKNFSEDKRKLSHVTGMIGLNQTPNEKAAGVMRLNWIVLRESDFNSDRTLLVAQCLALGRAYCCGLL